MGLDQVAWTFPHHDDLPEIIATDKDLPSYWNDDERIVIAQWRKHPNLQGWMEKLYFKKKEALQFVLPDNAGGHFGEFNTVAIRIHPHELDRLEAAVLNNKLPETEGFFFGVSQPEDKELDVAFIAAARQAYADGKVVYYDSWW